MMDIVGWGCLVYRRRSPIASLLVKPSGFEVLCLLAGPVVVIIAMGDKCPIGHAPNHLVMSTARVLVQVHCKRNVLSY